VNEDPVTGSAHCALCPYWLERAASISSSPPNQLLGIQASARQGEIRVARDGDRVLLSGSCVTTMTANILV
jgi:predicted PhzF superfamily epimerase YddE/YHI9